MMMKHRLVTITRDWWTLLGHRAFHNASRIPTGRRHTTSSQIDHIAISSKFRSYLLDMRNEKIAEVGLERSHSLACCIRRGIITPQAQYWVILLIERCLEETGWKCCWALWQHFFLRRYSAFWQWQEGSHKVCLIAESWKRIDECEGLEASVGEGDALALRYREKFQCGPTAFTASRSRKLTIHSSFTTISSLKYVKSISPPSLAAQYI